MFRFRRFATCHLPGSPNAGSTSFLRSLSRPRDRRFHGVGCWRFRRSSPSRCDRRGRGLLVTPALGIGDRLLSLIQGKPSRLDVQAPAWSPDGRTIVFVSWRDGNGEVYAMDADSSGPRNLTQHPATDVRPAWSPDGRRIAFVSRATATPRSTS